MKIFTPFLFLLLLAILSYPSRIYAQSPCSADINTDSIVDLRDYSILVANFFSTSPSPPRADINTDGIVDLRDYSLLVSEFFQECKTTGTAKGPQADVAAPANAIVLSPSDDIQYIIDANPTGTTYFFSSGLYRLAEIAPKLNDTYIGQYGAILSGAKVLDDFMQDGNIWVTIDTQPAGQVHGSCRSETPRCNYPHDVYIDNTPLVHAATKESVTPGFFYFDFDADRIYIGDDPAGKIVEVATARTAFHPTADNVTIKNLTIEKYATPAQMGAIGDQYPKDGWVIENNLVRLNHGTGINMRSNAEAKNNIITHNGQKGIGASGTDGLVENNEISHNNYAGFNNGWEAGGSKFSYTDSLVVRNNYVHHNDGPGLWTDIDNIHTLIEGNIVEHNNFDGIKHEISYDATIRDNTARYNGKSYDVWLWGAQIDIQNSQNTEVYDNIVTVASTYGDGIAVIHQNRGTGAYGPWEARNNHIHHNTITFEGSYGHSGLVADYLQDEISTNGNNRFDYNTYIIQSLDEQRFSWLQSKNWSEFQQLGYEKNGTIEISN